MTESNRPARPTCPICRKGQLQPATTFRDFHPRDELVRVELLTSVCDHCGKNTVRAAQHDENLDRLAARKAHYKGLLLGEEFVALRARYGLTQQAASKIFGKGKIAFSRYENEATYPDDSTTALIKQAIKRPEVLKDLADEAGVTLPLWQKRCDEDKASKLRRFALVSQPLHQQAFRVNRFDVAEAGNQAGDWSLEGLQA